MPSCIDHRVLHCLLSFTERPRCGMSRAGSSNKLRGIIELLYLYRSSCGNPKFHGHGSGLPMVKLRSGYSIHQGMQSISNNSCGFHRVSRINMVEDGKEKVEPAAVPAASAGWSAFSNRVKAYVVSILSLVLPFLNWEKFKTIEGEAEMVVGEVEKVAEVVEKVATATEQISGDVASILPDHSKLKDAALMVEHISHATAKDAKLTQHFIHKVHALKQDVEDLERMAGPIIHNISEEMSDGN